MSRVFAIVPAAGHSRRMGQPKLLLPWKNGLVIDSVMAAWTESKVDQVVVVTRRSDTELQSACLRWPVVVTWPDSDPPDMKASIQHGVRWLQTNLSPSPSEGDYWMVAPADLPTLRTNVIDEVIAARSPQRIVVPRFEGHESHPVLLPWSMSVELSSLPANVGLNALLNSHAKVHVDLRKSEYAEDIDTPTDYRRIVSE